MAILRRNRATQTPPPAPPPSSQQLSTRPAQLNKRSRGGTAGVGAGDFAEDPDHAVAKSELRQAEDALRKGDDELALELLHEAARKGSVEAMLNLAALANSADQLGEAKFWFQTAASLGNEKARQHLRDLERGKLAPGQGFTSSTREYSFAVGQRVQHPALGIGVVLDCWTPSDPLSDSMIVQFSKQVVRLNPAELICEPPQE